MLERRGSTSQGRYVFPGKKPDSHLVESKFSVAKIGRETGIKFMVHDLRRTFLTIAEGLDLPHYVLKRLANHKTADVTAGYIVAGPERLRVPMQMITDYVLENAGVKNSKKNAKTQKGQASKFTASHSKLSVAQ